MAVESIDRFTVVSNSEQQYSVWFPGRPLPLGWQASGFEGSRAECLAHIEEIWQDLRPLSLRVALAAGEAA
ncbi:MbtH family NRPS accessory protein [Streptomyces sp900105755]|uniref:MbtH family NRPS accessory protein n=1 Tax=Streptomyces sp. 900105755 TaxID=3154389 RepID=A0ABV1TEG8_9ACTN